MTARKPKPVRAWATLSLLTGQINRCTDATRAECIDTCGFVGETDYKPVRVTIVPDSTPSAEAEVRRLRKIVRAMVKWHRDVNFPTNCVCVWCEEFGPKRKRAALRGRRGR